MKPNILYREQIQKVKFYYPELQTINIEIVYGKISTTMACRPLLLKSMLFGKRCYRIFINNNSDFGGVLLEDVPYNAQLGVIGHEFSHILDYETKSNLGIIYLGIKYLFKKYKRTYERSIDKLTIQKGLGPQLYDWAIFSMYESKASDKYKKFKRDIYMSHHDIMQYMLLQH